MSADHHDISELLVLRLLIAATHRNEHDFAQAVHEVLVRYRCADEVITALSIRATDSMLALAETTIVTQPDSAARADLSERLEHRLATLLDTHQTPRLRLVR